MTPLLSNELIDYCFSLVFAATNWVKYQSASVIKHTIGSCCCFEATNICSNSWCKLSAPHWFNSMIPKRRSPIPLEANFARLLSFVSLSRTGRKVKWGYLLWLLSFIVIVLESNFARLLSFVSLQDCCLLYRDCLTSHYSVVIYCEQIETAYLRHRMNQICPFQSPTVYDIWKSIETTIFTAYDICFSLVFAG